MITSTSASEHAASGLPFSPVTTATAGAFPTPQKLIAQLSPPALHGPGTSPDTEIMARLGVNAIFRQRAVMITQQVLTQIERRDRMVLLLQDGQRSLGDVARLLHRSEVEVAHAIVRLLQRGYVEFVGMHR